MDEQEEDKFKRFFKVFDNIVISYLRYTEIHTPTIDNTMDLASKYWSVMVPLNEEGKLGDSNNFKFSDEVDNKSKDKDEQPIISKKYNQVFQSEIEMENLGRPIRDDDFVKADWRDIVDRFREDGWSMRMISKKIEAYIGNQIYSNYNMKYSTFQKLQEIANFVIPYSIVEKIRLDSLPEGNLQDNLLDGKINYIDQINPKLSEMLGVLHGDGGITDKYLKITLGQDELKYSEYVKKLALDTLKVSPILNVRTDCNALDLIINRKALVNELKILGMKTGNKTKNQAEVPGIVRKNPEMSIKFIKGLFDTDGSIFVHRRKTERIITLELNFSNANRNLTKFFAEICESNGIKVSGVYNKGGTNLSIHSRKGVVKFYEIFDSEKIKNFMQKWNFGRVHLERAFPYDPNNDFTKE